jgi:hypothetical protein
VSKKKKPTGKNKENPKNRQQKTKKKMPTKHMRRKRKKETKETKETGLVVLISTVVAAIVGKLINDVINGKKFWSVLEGPKSQPINSKGAGKTDLLLTEKNSLSRVGEQLETMCLNRPSRVPDTWDSEKFNDEWTKTIDTLKSYPTFLNIIKTLKLKETISNLMMNLNKSKKEHSELNDCVEKYGNALVNFENKINKDHKDYNAGKHSLTNTPNFLANRTDLINDYFKVEVAEKITETKCPSVPFVLIM